MGVPNNDLKAESFSPTVWRILQLAAIEASANRNQRGDRICDEHLLIAMLQCGEGDCGAFMASTGLTVNGIRSGNFAIKPTV